jgi:hypothetical protein
MPLPLKKYQGSILQGELVIPNLRPVLQNPQQLMKHRYIWLILLISDDIWSYPCWIQDLIYWQMQPMTS